jgi:hypothetical protein
VTLGKVATGAVDSAAVVDDSLTALDIGPGAVGSSELQANAVGLGKIANDAVGSAQVADYSLTNVDLAPNSVAATNIQSNAVGTVQVANDTVTTAKLADTAVATAKIADGAVTTLKLGADSVTGAKVSNGSLTANDLAGSAPGGPLAGQMSLDPPSIPASSCIVTSFGLNGVQVGDYTVVNPLAGLPYGLHLQPLTGIVNNLQIQFCNMTAAPLDPAAATYSYLAIHP